MQFEHGSSVLDTKLCSCVCGGGGRGGGCRILSKFLVDRPRRHKWHCQKRAGCKQPPAHTPFLPPPPPPPPPPPAVRWQAVGHCQDGGALAACADGDGSVTRINRRTLPGSVHRLQRPGGVSGWVTLHCGWGLLGWGGGLRGVAMPPQQHWGFKGGLKATLEQAMGNSQQPLEP